MVLMYQATPGYQEEDETMSSIEPIPPSNPLDLLKRTPIRILLIGPPKSGKYSLLRFLVDGHSELSDRRDAQLGRDNIQLRFRHWPIYPLGTQRRILATSLTFDIQTSPSPGPDNQPIELIDVDKLVDYDLVCLVADFSAHRAVEWLLQNRYHLRRSYHLLSILTKSDLVPGYQLPTSAMAVSAEDGSGIRPWIESILTYVWKDRVVLAE